MTCSNKTAKGFWDDYCIARTLLGLSEQEFWQSNPRKIKAMQYFYLLYIGKVRLRKTKEEIALQNKRQLMTLEALLKVK